MDISDIKLKKGTGAKIAEHNGLYCELIIDTDDHRPVIMHGESKPGGTKVSSDISTLSNFEYGIIKDFNNTVFKERGLLRYGSDSQPTSVSGDVNMYDYPILYNNNKFKMAHTSYENDVFNNIKKNSIYNIDGNLISFAGNVITVNDDTTTYLAITDTNITDDTKYYISGYNSGSGSGTTKWGELDKTTKIKNKTNVLNNVYDNISSNNNTLKQVTYNVSNSGSNNVELFSTTGDSRKHIKNTSDYNYYLNVMWYKLLTCDTFKNIGDKSTDNSANGGGIKIVAISDYAWTVSNKDFRDSSDPCYDGYVHKDSDYSNYIKTNRGVVNGTSCATTRLDSIKLTSGGYNISTLKSKVSGAILIPAIGVSDNIMYFVLIYNDKIVKYNLHKHIT